MLSQEGGYLVITARAGFGKTALVAQLVSREPSQIAYHFLPSGMAAKVWMSVSSCRMWFSSSPG